MASEKLLNTVATSATFTLKVAQSGAEAIAKEFTLTTGEQFKGIQELVKFIKLQKGDVNYDEGEYLTGIHERIRKLQGLGINLEGVNLDEGVTDNFTKLETVSTTTANLSKGTELLIVFTVQPIGEIKDEGVENSGELIDTGYIEGLLNDPYLRDKSHEQLYSIMDHWADNHSSQIPRNRLNLIKQGPNKLLSIDGFAIPMDGAYQSEEEIEKDCNVYIAYAEALLRFGGELIGKTFTFGDDWEKIKKGEEVDFYNSHLNKGDNLDIMIVVRDILGFDSYIPIKRNNSQGVSIQFDEEFMGFDTLDGGVNIDFLVPFNKIQ